MKHPDLLHFKSLSIDDQLNWIVKHYTQDLYWVIRPIVKTHENTDDVLQNTFIKVYQNLPKFRYDSRLFSWLYRIAVNESMSFLRKNKQQFITDSDSYLLNLLSQDPYYDGDDIALKLEKALLSLPPKQQEIFRLKYFNHMKFDEIAELTGTSVGGLKANYHLAVKKIKKFLNEN